MAFLSRRGPAAAGLAMALGAACTPVRGPLYALAPDASVPVDGAAIDAAASPDVTPAIDLSRCLTGCTALPVVVDEKFVASGYTDDWPGIKEVSTATDPAACSPTRASANAVGNCHHWTWSSSGGVFKDACVAWLRPDNLYTDPSNPGASAGLPIAPGAKAVRFWAWSPTQRAVSFSVGNHDSAAAEGFFVEKAVQLSTQPQLFTIDVSAAHYNIVNTGFRWCTNDPRFDNFDFYVDDIQWTADP